LEVVLLLLKNLRTDVLVLVTEVAV